MKNRKYIKCTVTSSTGRVFDNPLKCTEIHIIKTLANENKSVLVEMAEMSQADYELTFGKNNN